MQISLLTVVTFMNVLVSAESTFMRGGSANSDKDTNSNHRSLALSECIDSGEVLYKDKTCDWISAINNKKKMKSKCNKKTKLGRIYDLCPSTCSGVDLGSCTTSKLGETIKSLRATIADLEAPITDEDVTLNSVIFKDMKAEKEALEAALAGCGTIVKEKENEITAFEEVNASLRKTIATLEASPTSTTSPTKSPTNSIGVPNNPTSKCNAEDGEFAFDKCQCSEQTVLKDNACVKVPVDCDNGKERGTNVSCEKACDGQCCTGQQACSGFTGFVHRDGSCAGFSACKSARLDEVKGPSCTGNSACRGLKSTLVEASCNDPTNYSSNVPACKGSEIGLIEGSCNGSNISNCYYLIAASIVNGEVDVCSNECSSAYIAAGRGGSPGAPCSNDKEVGGDSYDLNHPNYCTYLACIDKCQGKTSSDEGPDPFPDFD